MTTFVKKDTKAYLGSRDKSKAVFMVRQGFALAEVSAKFNCKPTTLARWVQQYKPPDTDMIHDMAKEAIVDLFNDGIKGSDLTGIVNMLKLISGESNSGNIMDELMALGAGDDSE